MSSLVVAGFDSQTLIVLSARQFTRTTGISRSVLILGPRFVHVVASFFWTCVDELGTDCTLRQLSPIVS